MVQPDWCTETVVGSAVQLRTLLLHQSLLTVTLLATVVPMDTKIGHSQECA